MNSDKNKRSVGTDPNADEQTKLNTVAFSEAEADIEADVELSTEPEVGDDLDEGELARLEGED